MAVFIFNRGHQNHHLSADRWWWWASLSNSIVSPWRKDLGSFIQNMSSYTKTMSNTWWDPPLLYTATTPGIRGSYTQQDQVQCWHIVLTQRLYRVGLLCFSNTFCTAKPGLQGLKPSRLRSKSPSPFVQVEKQATTSWALARFVTLDADEFFYISDNPKVKSDSLSSQMNANLSDYCHNETLVLYKIAWSPVISC